MTVTVFLQIPLLGALWGLSFVFIRATAPSLGAIVVAESRTVVALLVYGIVLLLRIQKTGLNGRLLDYIALGTIGMALPFVLSGVAAKEISASLLALVNATVPFFALAYARIFLGETIGTRQIVGLPLALLGVAIIVLSAHAELRISPVGIASAVLSSAFYASGAIYAKARMSGLSTFDIAMGQSICVALLLLPSAVSAFPPTGISTEHFAYLLALGTLSTALPVFLYYRLVKLAGPTNATLVSFFIPLFGIIWGHFLLGERLTILQMSGGLLIIISVATVTNVGERVRQGLAPVRSRLFNPAARK